MSEQQAIINELQTSLMRSQETVSKLRSAIEVIEKAIAEERKMPEYHNVVIDRHRMEWGTLHNAIDKAIASLHG